MLFTATIFSQSRRTWPPSALENTIVPVDCARRSHLLHRSLIVQPATVSAAYGLELHLANGQTVIDACSGAAVACIGHGNEEVHSALVEQARKVGYVHTQAYTTHAAEDLADFILEGNSYGLEKALFVSSGSEAVESSMKLARQYHFNRNEPQRTHFVSRKQSYHGNTIAAMSVSHNMARKIPYQGFCYPNVSHVTPPFAYRYKRGKESEEEFSQRLLQELEAEFIKIGPGNVIAFIAEPVMGATAGCAVPPSGYFPGVRALCDKYGIVLILDEIMCGTGRTGTFFAFEQEGIVPDIVTTAKGLGGGYAAIAGVYIHQKIIHGLRQGTHGFVNGHTYQAHPISCAASLAVQKIIRREKLVERCHKMGQFLGKILCLTMLDSQSVGDIRGRGLFWALEFVRDRASKAPFDASVEFSGRVQRAAFERGVAVYPGSGTADGFAGDHILLAPPFTISEEQLSSIVQILKDAIESQEVLFLTEIREKHEEFIEPPAPLSC